MPAAMTPFAGGGFGSVAWVAAWLVAAVLLDDVRAETRGALASDPRYVGVDWALARDKLLLYVLSCLKRSPLEADDIVQRVFVQALKPNARPWDPATTPIGRYLGSLANTEIWNARKSAYENARRLHVTPALEATVAATDPDPLTALTRQAEETWQDAAYARVKAALVGDPLVVRLLSVFEERGAGPRESTARALEAGYTEKDVAAARRKIHREVAKVVGAGGPEALETGKARAR